MRKKLDKLHIRSEIIDEIVELKKVKSVYENKIETLTKQAILNFGTIKDKIDYYFDTCEQAVNFLITSFY